MMKKLVGMLIVVGSVVYAAEELKPVDISSGISEVTVYSDRALVARDAEGQKNSGTVIYAFRKLPGWIDESSVRVKVLPADAGRITDVRVEREYLARATDEQVRKAEESVQEISDRKMELDDELKILTQKETQVSSIRAFSLEKLPRDMAVREVDMAAYGKVVDYVSATLRDIADARRKVMIERRNLDPELSARTRKLNDLRQMMQLEQATVYVTMDIEREHELKLVYMLPGATWEPVHELRAVGKNPKTVSLASYAKVTQTTGEDWKNAEIFFSTQSPNETINIPELEALMLGGSHAVAQMGVVQSSSFSKAKQVYLGQNRMWYNVNNPGRDLDDYVGNWSAQTAQAAQSSRIFKTLQKRGTTAHFKGEGRPTVRSDGNQVRIPIGEVKLAAETRIVAAPQASLNAARTVEMINIGKQPLLPGKVSLFYDGSFLGMTDVDFIAQGETFSVFLGVEDQVKLSRTLDKRNSALTRGRRTKIQVSFLTTVENLSGDVVKINLADRIPVSENKEIEVYKVRIAPEVDPDSKGILKWEFTLKPREKRAYRIEYTIEYPPVVLQEMKRSRANQSFPAAEDSGDLQMQIENLEDMF